MMRRTRSCLLVFMAVSVIGNIASAKRITPPKSFDHEVRGRDAIDRRTLPPVDVAALLTEDAEPREAPVPYRVAYAMPLDLGIDDAGTWETLSDGGTLWRLRIDSPGAVFMSFKFSDFELPPGAELHFVSVRREYHDGAYSARHNRPEKRFGSPMIPGDAAIIELYLPPGSAAGPTKPCSISPASFAGRTCRR